MPTTVLTESRADLGRNNLSVLLTYESLGCGVFTLLHWITGGLLYSDNNALVVYGEDFVGLGGWMILLGFFAMVYCLAGFYAARHHNRVIIIVCIVLHSVSIFAEAALAHVVRNVIEPEFDAAVTESCLNQLPDEEIEDAGVCAQYFSSNRTVALWTLWQHWIKSAAGEGDGSDGSFQGVLLQVQSGYGCCGFSRPQMCRVNRTLTVASDDVYKGDVAFAGACGAFENDEGVFQPVERWCAARCRTLRAGCTRAHSEVPDGHACCISISAIFACFCCAVCWLVAPGHKRTEAATGVEHTPRTCVCFCRAGRARALGTLRQTGATSSSSRGRPSRTRAAARSTCRASLLLCSIHNNNRSEVRKSRGTTTEGK